MILYLFPATNHNHLNSYEINQNSDWLLKRLVRSVSPLSEKTHPYTIIPPPFYNLLDSPPLRETNKIHAPLEKVRTIISVLNLMSVLVIFGVSIYSVGVLRNRTHERTCSLLRLTVLCELIVKCDLNRNKYYDLL